MTLAVLWKREAIISLRKIIASTSNPDRVLAAVREIGRELRDDPASKGESREAGKRVIFAPPLGAQFTVQWRLNQVVVAEIWEYAERDVP